MDRRPNPTHGLPPRCPHRTHELRPPQLPKPAPHRDIRGCITADPGHVLIRADFAGIELRVAAALSGDDNLRHMIIDDVDIHWLIARQVLGPHATKADRSQSNPQVYGKLYGGGISTLAAQVGCRLDVAKRWSPPSTPHFFEVLVMLAEGRPGSR